MTRWTPITSGDQNTAVGNEALSSNLVSELTAVGAGALSDNTDGIHNAAFGTFALANNVHADNNTAIGNLALRDNDNTAAGSANNNTGVGWQALRDNIIGASNTAVGSNALLSNANSNNTAVGASALLNNTIGSANNAFGVNALRANLASGFHCAFGNNALAATTTGSFANNAFGVDALDANTTGSRNIAVGDDALGNNVIGSDNTAVGDSAGFNITRDNNICIGSSVFGIAGEFDTIRIGDNFIPILGSTSKTFIGGIFGANVTALSSLVFVNASGQLGTIPSSARFKEDIKPMGKTSEALFLLKPVTFRYKGDSTNLPSFGLIAEEVAKVNPDLILLDREGKPQTVRYEQVWNMMLNEFLKEHKRVEEQQSKIENQQASIAELKSTVAQQQKGMEVLTAQLKEQAAQIQKVSAQLEVNKPATKVAVGNQ